MTRQDVLQPLQGSPSPGFSPDLLAAIDIGSHSFRLEVAQLEGRRYRCVDQMQEVVRLAQGWDGQGRLSEAALLRGLSCLKSFARRLEALGVTQVRALVTQSLHEAANLDEFLRLGAAALGHPVERVSGREEARLVYAGVVGLRPISAERRLVIDLGGQATEMVLGEGSAPLAAESFPLGCATLSSRFFAEGGFTQAAFHAAQVMAGAALEESLETFASEGWSEALGSSPIIHTISKLLALHRISDGVITPEGLHWGIEQCLEAGQVYRLEMDGLPQEHRALLGGALALLMALFDQFDIEALHPTRGTLSQGVIFDLDERRSARGAGRKALDARHKAVEQLQQRFQVDTAQAGRVQELARRFHAGLEADAGGEARSELEWAAALHELGMAVSHHDHHRHSAYLLTHADVAGFSQSQQHRLGTLVLGQRGRLRKIEGFLAEPDFVSQVLALRLAVLFCHARSAPAPEAVRVARVGGTVVVSLRADWAQDHSHALYRLQEEKASWERTEILKLAIKIERRT